MRLYGMEDGINIHERVLQWCVSEEGKLRQGGIDVVNCGYGTVPTSGAYLERYLIVVSGDNANGEERTSFYLTHGDHILNMPWQRNAFTSMEERAKFYKKINLSMLAREKDSKDFEYDEISKMTRTFVDEITEKHRERKL